MTIVGGAGVRLARLCGRLLAGLDAANGPGVVHVRGSVLANSGPVRESFEADLTAKAKRSLSVESPALSAAKGAALMALGMLAFTLEPSSVMIISLGVLLGAGATLVHVGTNVFAIDISPIGARGRFFGQTQAAMHAAALVGPIVVGGLADWAGFGSAFVLLAVFFAALAPVGMVMARHQRAMARSTESTIRPPSGGPSA